MPFNPPRPATHAPEAYSGNPWVRVEMKDALVPGGSADAYILIERDETKLAKLGWVSPGYASGAHTRDPAAGDKIGPGNTNATITVHDRWDSTDLNGIDWGANYLLPGERAWAQWDTSTQQHQIVGSQGLLRRAIADEDIDSGSSGDVSIQDNDGDSGETIEAHATWGAGTIVSGSKIWVRYDQPQGKWIVFSTAGAQFLKIWFKVETETTETRSAQCTVLGVPDGLTISDIPGQILPNIVEVCDPAGCYFNEPVGELIDRQGYAWYMTPLQATLCQPDGYDLESEWVVDSLCCKATACD